MSKSVYIVNNEEQESEVLKQLFANGYEYPVTKILIPGLNDSAFDGFPYEIIADNESHYIYWRTIPKSITNVCQLNEPDELIIYDGREENEKMKISKEVYDALVEWRDANHLDHTHINGGDLLRLPTFILNFWLELGISQNEANNRLIAIIRWVNGEDVFEIETSSKWIVKSKEKDDRGKYFYVSVSKDGVWFSTTTAIGLAKQFNSKEEADKYANILTESVPYN